MRAFVAAGMLAWLLAGCARPPATASAWNPDAAAGYLDRRADWWMSWRDAARDQGTFCISCHTTLPYALARPALDRRGNGTPISARERRILEDVRTRVRHWDESAPYYGARARQSTKASESRATESVLNAVILADADARAGRLSDVTRQAFDHMWALQQPDGPQAGAWPWLQFGLDPWEGRHAGYFGAALAALATGTAPESYASTLAIQPNVDRLRAYLDREYGAQPLSNRAVLLWASARLPRLVDDRRRARIAADLRGAQQSDGGWSLESLDATGWSLRRLSARSDGYATGLAALALSTMSGTNDRNVARGLAWLDAHQNAADGSWPGYSLNALENPTPEVARFMDDAATAYAVLALAGASDHVK